MATLQDVTSKETEMILLGSHKKMPVKKLPIKNILSKESVFAMTDPIDPKRVSKEPTEYLKASSIVKAGFVFSVTIGVYYLAKATKILSSFVLGKNSKDANSGEITKVNNDFSLKKALKTSEKTASSPFINYAASNYKKRDETIKFKEIDVKEFKNFQRRSLNERSRRSINLQNSIPDQNAIIGKSFELTIDGSHVFSSSSALFIESTNIPNWLNFLLLDPNPTFTGSYNTPGGTARDVVVSGNYAYVANDHYGLQIIDITDPTNPTFKGSYDAPNQAYDVAVSGNYVYLASFDLQIIDISDPSNPIFISSYGTPYIKVAGVAISGDYAYIVGGTSTGLQIIDITDPANPTFKGTCDEPYLSKKVLIFENYAYIAEPSGLLIIDVTDPSNPTFKGSYDTSWALEVALSGNYAYVADAEGGLKIIDVSNPSNPTLEASYDMVNEARGIAVSGNYAYVATSHRYPYSSDKYSDLQIIDINDPSNPKFKASYNISGATSGIAVSGNYAYVTEWYSTRSGLWIIALNFDQLMLSGIPNSTGTYGVNITACNEEEECLTDSFDIRPLAQLKFLLYNAA
jgi:hypothetical protein